MIRVEGLDWPRSQAEWFEHNKWFNRQKLMEWQANNDRAGESHEQVS